MTFAHGSKATLKWGSSATPTTLVDYSTFLNSISFPQQRDTAETTTFTATTKSYIPGLRDATFSCDGRMHPTLEGGLMDLMGAGNVNFEYCPQGTGVTGTPKYTGSFFLTSYQSSSDISNVGGVTAQFQISGNVVRTIQ